MNERKKYLINKKNCTLESENTSIAIIAITIIAIAIVAIIVIIALVYISVFSARIWLKINCEKAKKSLF